MFLLPLLLLRLAALILLLLFKLLLLLFNMWLLLFINGWKSGGMFSEYSLNLSMLFGMDMECGSNVVPRVLPYIDPDI